MFYTFFNFVFARFTIFFRSIHILHRPSHVMFVRFCRSAWSVTSCVYSYCVIRCAYRHPASVTYMLSHFIHLPQCSLSFTSFYVYCAVFYRAPSAMSFYSNIVTTTQAGSACSVDARPALVPIFIWSCFLAPNFFFSRGSPFSSDCCRPAFAGGNLYQPVAVVIQLPASASYSIFSANQSNNLVIILYILVFFSSVLSSSQALTNSC